MTARAADPATLFRPGGPSLGDIMRERFPAPANYPRFVHAEYQLHALFHGEASAHQFTRYRIEIARRSDAARQARPTLVRACA